MAFVPVIFFALGLVGIFSLFSIKYLETERGFRVVPQELHKRADHNALLLKERLTKIREDLAKVGPFLVLYSRYLVHEAALGFASVARFSEKKAHELADFVSHKRHFAPRERRSEFLKSVEEARVED